MDNIHNFCVKVLPMKKPVFPRSAKHRYSVCLHPTIQKQATALAEAHGLSFSSLIEHQLRQMLSLPSVGTPTRSQDRKEA